MTDAAADDPVLVFARELLRIRVRLRMRRAVGVALQRNRGHTDDWCLREAGFESVVARFTLRQPEPPAVIMNDDIDVIWIV